MRTQKETDLQAENERLQASLKSCREGSVIFSRIHDRHVEKIERLNTELNEHEARIAELEGDLDAAEEYICELRAEKEWEI